MTDTLAGVEDIVMRRTSPAAINRRLEAINDGLRDVIEDVARMGAPSSKLMGVTEVAQALDVSASLISTWLARGKMPEPIARLKAGPIWTEAQLDAMLRLKREGGA